MVGPEGIQPLAQSMADRIHDHLDDAFHLPISLAIASCQLLVHDAKYLTQALKAPLELQPMICLHIPWFTPLVHNVL